MVTFHILALGEGVSEQSQSGLIKKFNLCWYWDIFLLP